MTSPNRECYRLFSTLEFLIFCFKIYKLWAFFLPKRKRDCSAACRILGRLSAQPISCVLYTCPAVIIPLKLLFLSCPIRQGQYIFNCTHDELRHTCFNNHNILYWEGKPLEYCTFPLKNPRLLKQLSLSLCIKKQN